MPLFENSDNKVLFIHIPKTGGTSIERLLATHSLMTLFSPAPPAGLRVCPQHLTFSDLKILFGEKYWDWSFAVVRNPYDRLESEYCFRHGLGSHRFGENICFSDWVKKCINNVRKDPFFWDNHFRPQTDFLDDEVEVFQFEAGLNLAVEQAVSRLDLELDDELTTHNSSKRKKLNWTRDALDLVNVFYSDDFVRLDYKKK